jgi:hypothetical protein
MRVAGLPSAMRHHVDFGYQVLFARLADDRTMRGDDSVPH